MSYQAEFGAAAIDDLDQMDATVRNRILRKSTGFPLTLNRYHLKDHQLISLGFTSCESVTIA
jgi:hypothetical protein